MNKASHFIYLFIIVLLSAALVWMYMNPGVVNSPVVASAEVSTSDSTKTSAEIKKISKKEIGINLFDDTQIHTLNITFKNEKYWDTLLLFKQIKDSLEVNRYLAADITIDGNTLPSAIGVRMKGESSFEFTKGRKKSFRLRFNKFKKKQEYDGVYQVNLNNNFKDPTMMREKLFFDLLAKLGVKAPRAAYAKVYINGEYNGLYLLNEQIDKQFLKFAFGKSKGNLYIGEPNPDLNWYGSEQENYIRKYRLKKNKKANDWSDLIHLLDVIHNFEGSDLEHKNALEQVFNLESCLKTWALCNVILNIDAYNMFYSHNMYFYSNPGNGLMEWIPYDGNYSFGAWSPTLNLKQMENLSLLYVRQPAENRPFAQFMLQDNTAIRDQYLRIVKEEVMPIVNPKVMNERIDQLTLLIRDAVYEDTHKMLTDDDFDINLVQNLGDPKDPGAFTPGLKSFIKKRHKMVIQQLELHKPQ